MQILDAGPGRYIWPIAIIAALVAHGLTFGVLSESARIASAKPQPVKVRIVENRPEAPKVVEPPPPPPPKPKPRKPEPKKVATERPKHPRDPALPPPKPVQGMAADAMVPGGKVAAPLGNTLMTADTGERLKAAPPPLDSDLSADAKLLRDSVITPQYTDAALDANVEGYVTVDVLVDASGVVTDAELKKKVGYGMDDRIVKAALAARFTPRKNRLGAAEAGWTEIRFNLQIP